MWQSRGVPPTTGSPHSAPAFLFGYLTDRLTDEKDIKLLLEGYDGAGVLKEVEEAKAKIREMEQQRCDPEEMTPWRWARPVQ